MCVHVKYASNTLISCEVTYFGLFGYPYPHLPVFKVLLFIYLFIFSVGSVYRTFNRPGCSCSCFINKVICATPSRHPNINLITTKRNQSDAGHLVLGWLYSECACDAAVLSTAAAAVLVLVLVAAPAAAREHVLVLLLLLLLHRSSEPGAGMESTEQMLDRDEISLWLESDRLSARPAGRRL